MASFDVLRVLIKSFKEDELDYEVFCDAVDEFTSDATEKFRLVLGLRKYSENIEFYNFADLKSLSESERSKLSIYINDYIYEYSQDHGISDEWDDSIDG